MTTLIKSDLQFILDQILLAEADAQGVGALDYVDPKASFEGDTPILGRGVIVHAKADDLKTQPTGDAGGRLACGVIGVAKGE